MSGHHLGSLYPGQASTLAQSGRGWAWRLPEDSCWPAQLPGGGAGPGDGALQPADGGYAEQLAGAAEGSERAGGHVQ